MRLGHRPGVSEARTGLADRVASATPAEGDIVRDAAQRQVGYVDSLTVSGGVDLVIIRWSAPYVALDDLGGLFAVPLASLRAADTFVSDHPAPASWVLDRLRSDRVAFPETVTLLVL